MSVRGAAMRLLLTVFGMLPLRANHALGAALGHGLRLLAVRERTVTRINLGLCWPELAAEERARLARRSFVEAGKAITELAFFWRRPANQVLSCVRQIHGQQFLEQASTAGHGVLLAAPHLGAWELLCLYLSSRGPCSILYREPRDRGVAHAITAGRERLGAELVKADAAGVRALFRASKQNRLVGILPDQRPKRGNGEFAPFFGQPALTMVLYSRLAARCPAALVIAWAERLPRGAGYDLHFARIDDAVRDRDLAVSTAALNAAIEAEVRKCPAQYQWSYKRFSIQPDDRSPYH